MDATFAGPLLAEVLTKTACRRIPYVSAAAVVFDTLFRGVLY
jgi:hypothetical protein